MPLRFLNMSGLLLIWVGLSFYGSEETLLFKGASPFYQGFAALGHLLLVLLLIVAVIGIQTDPRTGRSKTTRVGAILILVAAAGLALRAFSLFLLACLPEAHTSPALLSWLEFRQPLLLWPFALAFLLGGGVYSAGFYHIDATSPWAKRVFIVALVWLVLGSAAVTWAGLAQVWVRQGYLAWVSLGYLWMGAEVGFRWRPLRANHP
ncbi:hypothetical protein COW36_01695 [bacterium (Candidatus Blackallbacteria) CG17_big_fil_post_rev_8_21_14_2_50_48_46]|uniref:Uncharacterized protein n=1 Tax=bacterium (Candidatus Blackallbacteria) CG17_big_fil_post_rev_8_21_14_2_50_48_46 TaxID=2014261 RepID=A0A2M7GAH3_9BACT|nr:MAG: hypothetical protein COW64_26085 [bacterium (Candidatus Blackallbacteria) CG18_big_fil_WC_8_21_14_2_50_49_26]PIW19151.1 MAG: hypothetical protein COW36_01695 [bacterium (Candidatus Blackallbacteria) CG17_big_fil_post_rev_8_21_14_2_50_48_46]PIW45499.1 MAG: hypothetical protein COW20_20445 [bacterium (Candidatus Blackallbacteria) CG13_big_fil_rev_8_21_14_2_50_49_14]